MTAFRLRIALVSARALVLGQGAAGRYSRYVGAKRSQEAEDELDVLVKRGGVYERCASVFVGALGRDEGPHRTVRRPPPIVCSPERVSAPSYSRYFELSEDRSTGTYVKTNKLGSPTSCVHCQPL
jgi:hypothetical protein